MVGNLSSERIHYPFQRKKPRLSPKYKKTPVNCQILSLVVIVLILAQAIGFVIYGLREPKFPPEWSKSSLNHEIYEICIFIYRY